MFYKKIKGTVFDLTVPFIIILRNINHQISSEEDFRLYIAYDDCGLLNFLLYDHKNDIAKYFYHILYYRIV